MNGIADILTPGIVILLLFSAFAHRDYRETRARIDNPIVCMADTGTRRATVPHLRVPCSTGRYPGGPMTELHYLKSLRGEG